MTLPRRTATSSASIDGSLEGVYRPAIAERTVTPDYSLADVLELRSEEELRAVADNTRRRILSLLRNRAASTTELAAALGQPKGTVGHHLKVLEEANLIRVVRTRKVRAMTEKYYGRTARLFLFEAEEAPETVPG